MPKKYIEIASPKDAAHLCAILAHMRHTAHLPAQPAHIFAVSPVGWGRNISPHAFASQCQAALPPWAQAQGWQLTPVLDYSNAFAHAMMVMDVLAPPLCHISADCTTLAALRDIPNPPYPLQSYRTPAILLSARPVPFTPCVHYLHAP
jgi:hypothetical protein